MSMALVQGSSLSICDNTITLYAMFQGTRQMMFDTKQWRAGEANLADVKALGLRFQVENRVDRICMTILRPSSASPEKDIWICYESTCGFVGQCGRSMTAQVRATTFPEDYCTIQQDGTSQHEFISDIDLAKTVRVDITVKTVPPETFETNQPDPEPVLRRSARVAAAKFAEKK